MIASCRVWFDVRLASSPACSSRTRRMLRSIVAALFSRTSSAIDDAFARDPVENAAPLLVEAGIEREGEVFEPGSLRPGRFRRARFPRRRPASPSPSKSPSGPRDPRDAGRPTPGDSGARIGHGRRGRRGQGQPDRRRCPVRPIRSWSSRSDRRRRGSRYRCSENLEGLQFRRRHGDDCTEGTSSLATEVRPGTLARKHLTGFGLRSSGMSRRKLLIALALATAAAAGWWVYRNASIERLRGEFRPWMARLERWRDANEAARRALRSREATVRGSRGDRPAARVGVERARPPGLRRLPGREADARRRTTTGRVAFTVGGFRPDGARVERSASAIVTEAHPASPARGSRVRSASRRLSPSGSRPRRGSATHRRGGPGRAAAGPAARQGQPPHRGHLAGLGRRGPRLRPATAPRTSSSATACARSSTRATARGASRT